MSIESDQEGVSGKAGQYDLIGNDYIDSKDKFFEGVYDFGKEFIYEHLTGLSGKLLDVGCGAGTETGVYRQAGFDVQGVDPSSVMVEEAEKRLGAGVVQLGSWSSIPYAKESFDVITARFSLHYVEDLDIAYKEAFRVLKPQGVMLVVIPHPNADLNITNRNGKELVEVSLFNSSVSITYPKHAMEQYFSDTFRNLFEVVEQNMYESPERDDSQEGIPDTIVFKAIKK